jgi:hypothetical protein
LTQAIKVASRVSGGGGERILKAFVAL